MKRILATLVLAASLFALPALALDLQQARGSGLVGEKLDGYIAALKPSADVSALVAEVNVKRKAEYTRISKQNNQPVDVVAKLAVQEIVSGLPKGAYYQAADGSWKTK